MVFMVGADSPALSPNTVFILADDLGYRDVGFNRSTWYETPALDALAKQSSSSLRQCLFCLFSSRRCSAKRKADLSNRHLHCACLGERGRGREHILTLDPGAAA